MPYKVLVGGVEIVCDSADEAIAIVQRAGGSDSSHRSVSSHEGGASGSRWTEARMADFFRFIKAQQKRVIDALLDHPEGRTDEQLCQLLGLDDGRKLAGVLTGIW